MVSMLIFSLNVFIGTIWIFLGSASICKVFIFELLTFILAINLSKCCRNCLFSSKNIKKLIEFFNALNRAGSMPELMIVLFWLSNFDETNTEKVNKCVRLDKIDKKTLISELRLSINLKFRFKFVWFEFLAVRVILRLKKLFMEKNKAPLRKTSTNRVKTSRMKLFIKTNIKNILLSVNLVESYLYSIKLLELIENIFWVDWRLIFIGMLIKIEIRRTNREILQALVFNRNLNFELYNWSLS